MLNGFSPQTPQILVVCSRPDDISYFQRALQISGFPRHMTAHSADTALNIIENETVNIVLIDNELHPDGGMKLLVLIKRMYPMTPCVLIVRQNQVHTAVQAIGMGGDDYLLRDEIFTLSLGEVIRDLTSRRRSPNVATESFGETSVFRQLRRIFLLTRRICTRFSYQPGWESLSDEMFSIFDCDAWGYMLNHDNGVDLLRFESAPMSDEAQEQLVTRLVQAWKFHGEDVPQKEDINLKSFQIFRSNEEIEYPFRDITMPLYAEGRCVGLLFLLYRTPRKITVDRTELLTYMSSIMSYTLDMGEIFNRLSQLAMYDETTECYNRNYFLKLLEIETTRVERYKGMYSMVLVDIDHFKKINREYGYEFGNFVLQNAAELIREQIRTIDIVSRIGGEEFAVILPSTNVKGASLFAERLRKNFAAQKFTTDDGRSVSITATITLGEYQPKIHHSGEGLLIRLERILAIKQDISNQVVLET